MEDLHVGTISQNVSIYIKIYQINSQTTVCHLLSPAPCEPLTLLYNFLHNKMTLIITLGNNKSSFKCVETVTIHTVEWLP